VKDVAIDADSSHVEVEMRVRLPMMMIDLEISDSGRRIAKRRINNDFVKLRSKRPRAKYQHARMHKLNSEQRETLVSTLFTSITDGIAGPTHTRPDDWRERGCRSRRSYIEILVARNPRRGRDMNGRVLPCQCPR